MHVWEVLVSLACSEVFLRMPLGVVVFTIYRVILILGSELIGWVIFLGAGSWRSSWQECFCCFLQGSWWVKVAQSCLTLTPWTVAHQAPLSMKDFPGKNTGVCSHSLLQGTFLTQGLNLGLLHCRQILYHLGHEENPQGSLPARNG